MRKSAAILSFVLCILIFSSCVNDNNQNNNESNQDDSVSIEDNNTPDGDMTLKDEVYAFLTETRYVLDGDTPLITVVIESCDELSEIYDVQEILAEENWPPEIYGSNGKRCSEGTYGEEYFENGYIIAVITHMGRFDNVYIAEGEKVGGSISVRFEQCKEGLTDSWGRVISLVPIGGKYDGETIVVSRIDFDPGDPNNPRTWAD